MQNSKIFQDKEQQANNLTLERFYNFRGYRKIYISELYYPMEILLPELMDQYENDRHFSMFCIRTAEDLALLHSLGIEYVWALGDDAMPENNTSSPNAENEQKISKKEKRLSRNNIKKRYVSLSIELAKSKTFFQQSHEQVRVCLESIRKTGIIPVREVENVVDNITSSVARNPNALLCMRGLQSADEYTYFHSINVSLLATIFAKFLGYSPREVWNIGYAGILHDIGKQKIPLELLHAPRKLSDKEFEIMKLHPQLACNILNDVQGLAKGVIEAVFSHHERFDGTGYPQGLKDDKIHPYATILSMTDIYDALTNSRPYKRAFSPNKAISIIYDQKNTSFSPEMVTQFINCFGLYPVGSLVRLSNNNLAIVYENNDGDLRKPKVLQLPRFFDRILTNHIKPIDLSSDKETLEIISSENADAYDYNLQELLLNHI